jgi:hypothetical protein
MNRALERISPKPMVDGASKSFAEFQNGCDEKTAVNRDRNCQLNMTGCF